MEPAKAQMKIYLGEFPVVECTAKSATINIGGNVHVTMDIAGLPIILERGATLPLFTYLPYDPEPYNALYGLSPKQ